MSWIDDFIPLAEWSLRQQDLRHRYLFASNAASVMLSSGIERTLETMVVLSIYEAALGKGYQDKKTIGYERAYPNSDGKNPKRADLAFKDNGKGKNWAYIEVKYYGSTGKAFVQNDINKLRGIEQRLQRWVFVYRVRKAKGTSQPLQSLLSKNFPNDLAFEKNGKFETRINNGEEDALCEFVLARVT